MPTLDTFYRSILPALPPEHRRVAADLPFRLGLTRSPEGGWESFIELEPNRDLVAFAAEGQLSPGEPALPEAALDRYRHAYFCGVYHGILADRLADRQAPRSPELVALLPHLERLWRRALAEATSDEGLSRRAVEGALASFQRGTELEREALARRSMSISLYGEIVELKSRWIGVPAVCLLQRAGAARRAALFELAHDLMILGLQCVDDAVDRAEDEATRGASIPGALGFPAGGLFRAGPKVTRLARAPARAGGFARLDRWLAGRAEALEGVGLEGDPLQNELAGVVIATSLEASCPWGDTRPRLCATDWLIGPRPS